MLAVVVAVGFLIFSSCATITGTIAAGETQTCSVTNIIEEVITN